jgi:hypothetical protein
MVCPSCGAQTEAQDRFCATCGAPLPEATPPQPPRESAAVPPPRPAAQYGAPRYGANPIAGLRVFAGGLRAVAGGLRAFVGGLRALFGGLVAIASAWLPWINDSSGRFSLRPIDATDMSDLACGYYLLIGGGIAVACGLLLVLRVRRGTSLPLLLGIGAIAGSALVLAVEAVAYGRITDTINRASGLGADTGISIGYGLWVGTGAGVVGALGGLLGLFNRRT